MHLFGNQESLEQIVQQIVVPNLRLREADEELFEDNPQEWIQRDMEGSTHTRRRCACELVRGMTKHFEAQAPRSVRTTSSTSCRMRNRPANKWQSKDAALLLLLSIAIKAQTAATGVSQTGEAVNVLDIINAHIVRNYRMPM